MGKGNVERRHRREGCSGQGKCRKETEGRGAVGKGNVGKRQGMGCKRDTERRDRWEGCSWQGKYRKERQKGRVQLAREI